MANRDLSGWTVDADLQMSVDGRILSVGVRPEGCRTQVVIQVERLADLAHVLGQLPGRTQSAWKAQAELKRLRWTVDLKEGKQLCGRFGTGAGRFTLRHPIRQFRTVLALKPRQAG